MWDGCRLVRFRKISHKTCKMTFGFHESDSWFLLTDPSVHPKHPYTHLLCKSRSHETVRWLVFPLNLKVTNQNNELKEALWSCSPFDVTLSHREDKNIDFVVLWATRPSGENPSVTLFFYDHCESFCVWGSLSCFMIISAAAAATDVELFLLLCCDGHKKKLHTVCFHETEHIAQGHLNSNI